MDNLIEQGIRSLVDALNSVEFVGTVYSCEGHFDRPRREKFLPTAYVTFGVTDVGEFARLYDRIQAANLSVESARLRLTYDCILGRYTLSIWPDTSLRAPSRKRSVVSSVVAALSEVIREFSGEPSAPATKAGDKNPAALPCGESVPPCTLVIPPKHIVCPFTKPRKEGRGNSR